MHLILGKSKRKERQEKHCFFCGTGFAFAFDDVIVCASGEGWLGEIAERHVCPSCARLDDAGIARRVQEAAGRHRKEAARLRREADAEDTLAERFDTLNGQPIERVWNANTF